MDKKRMILASLASAAVLGAGFTATQQAVVKADDPIKTNSEQAAEAKKAAEAKVVELEKKAAEAKSKAAEAETALTAAKQAAEKAAQNEFSANFDEALDETIKGLEEDLKNNPELKDQIQGFIDELKKQAGEKKAAFETAFKEGKTAAEVEKEVEEVAKAEEEAEAREAKEEADAQTAFLEKFDKDLNAIIEKLEKTNTENNAELEAQKQETIKALREEAAETRKQIEEGFKNGLTAEDAEEAIEESNKKSAEEAAEKAKAEADAQAAFLDNFDKSVNATVKELEEYANSNPEIKEKIQRVIAEFKKQAEEKKAGFVQSFKDGVTAKEVEKEVEEVAKAEEEAEAREAKEEADAQTAFLEKFDKDLNAIIEKLEKTNTENNAELEAQKQETIKALREEAAETRKQIEEGFKNGLTAEDAEEAIEESNKKSAEEAAEKAKAEADAQAAFLDNFDKSVNATVKELEEYANSNPEIKEQIQKFIDKFKEDLAVERAEFVKGFQNGLTAEEAEEEVEKVAKAEEEAEATETKEETDNKEALKAALEKLEKEAEDRINNDSRIKSEDKAKALEEAKVVIGKDAILKAIENGDISATEAAKELENQSNTANETSATEQEGKPLADLPAEDKKELDKADNKEASKPIIEKLTDIADDLAEKIEKLAEVAEKDKADSTTKAEKFEKQNETLEKVTVAVEAAKKNSSNQAVLDALQIAEKQLQADTKEAKAKFDEVHESLQANTEEINELADEYNEILGSIEGVSKTPTVEALPEYTGAVATKGDEAAPTVEALPEYTESVATNTPADENGEAVLPPVENNEYNGSLGTAGDEATPKVEVPEYNDGVSDEEAPVEPAKPEAPKPAEKSEAEKKVETLETEVTALEELLTTNNNNKAIKDLLNSRRSALARAEKALNTTKPATPTFAVLAAELEVPTASEALKAEVAKLEEELKTADASKKEELTKKLEALKADLSLVEKAEKEADLKDALKALEPKEDKVVFSKGQVLPPVQAEAPEFTGNVNGVESAVNEVPEFGANKPEIKKILKEIGEVRTQIENGEENGAEPYYIEGLKERLNDLLEAFDILNNNKPAVNEVPEYKLPAAPAQSVTPTVAGTSKDKTYQAPAAKEEAKKVLPNTGGKESAALASAGFLGLVLCSLPFAKRKN